MKRFAGSQMASLRWALVLALLTPLSAGADNDDGYGPLREQVKEFRADAKARKYRHNYDKQIRTMRRFAAQNPESDRADDALYVAAQLLDELYAVSYVASDLDDAVEAYLEVAGRFPNSNLADDALFRVARIRLERRGDKEGARRALTAIVEMKGAPDFGPRARELLSRLPAPPEPKATAKKPASEVAAALDAGLSRTADDGPHETNERVRGVVVQGQKDGRAVKVKSVRLRGKKKARRLDVKLSGKPEISVGVAPRTDKKPKRMFYDIRPAKLPRPVLKPLNANTAVAKRIRAAQFDEDTVRVVVELASDHEPTTSFDDKKKTFSLALVVPPAPKAPVLAKAEAPEEEPDEEAKPESAKGEAPAPAAPRIDKKTALRKAKVEVNEVKRRLGTTGAPGGVSISQQMGLEVRRVVIDAGHGGKDTGAVGPTGLKEKDVTLAIARTIKAKLKKKLPGLEVILTRDTDDFVELKDRTDIANNAGADLFISIHANANPSRKVRGVETYYLNITHDRYAMRLAARENRDAGGDQQISDLEFILADLAMKSNVDDSIRLGRHVQTSLVGRLRKDYKRVDDHGLKHALFYVLLGSRMPAILVETSFISNRSEEKRLASKAYREAVADGVVKGVSRFVAERQAFAKR